MLADRLFACGLVGCEGRLAGELRCPGRCRRLRRLPPCGLGRRATLMCSCVFIVVWTARTLISPLPNDVRAGICMPMLSSSMAIIRLGQGAEQARRRPFDRI